MKNNLPYSVPEGYFEELNGKLLKRRPFRFAPVIAVAASVAILIGIGRFLSSSPEPAQAQQASHEDEIIEYLIYSGAPLAYFDDNL